MWLEPFYRRGYEMDDSELWENAGPQFRILAALVALGRMTLEEAQGVE